MRYNVRKTETGTGTWAASSDIQLTLPNDGAITRIVLYYALTGTGILAADTNTEFPQFKPIQNLKVEGSKGTYLGLSGEQMGRVMGLLNMYDFPGKTFYRRMATNTIYGALVLHFGSRPRDAYGRDNPFDLTAFIPAEDESPNGLKLTITTTAASDICDTAVDISAGTFYADVYKVQGLPNMSGMRPMGSSEFYNHVANKSDLSDLHDVPTGCYLRRIVLLSQDATATSSGGPLLAGDEIAKVGLLLPKENRRLIESDWGPLVSMGGIHRFPAMTAAGAVTKPIDGANEGFAVLDLREYGHPDYGLDLRNYQTGDVKLGLTIQNYASGDDTIIFYDTVQPYTGRSR